MHEIVNYSYNLTNTIFALP